MSIERIDSCKKRINEIEAEIDELGLIEDDEITIDEKRYISLLIQELRNTKIDYLYELSKED